MSQTRPDRWRHPSARGLAALVAALAALAGIVRAGQAAQSPAEGTRHVYFTVVDRNGEPIRDLSGNEVAVREDGAARTVVDLRAATAPLQIALLVDDSGPGLRSIREGTGLFIKRLGGLGEISLTSTGAKNTPLVDFTSRLDELYAGVRRLTTRNTANALDGGYLLDAVHDAIAALNERAPERPVIVVLTLESSEFSSRRAVSLLDELRASRAVLDVVAVGKPTLKAMSSWNEGPMQSIREGLDENINRRKFLEDGVRQSGGRFEQVLNDSGVPAAMNAIAAELASQYVAVYSRPAAQAPPRRISIAVTRAGARVRVRTELPRLK